MKIKKKNRFRFVTIITTLEVILILLSVFISSFIITKDTEQYKSVNKDLITREVKAIETSTLDVSNVLLSFGYENSHSQSMRLLSGHYFDINQEYFERSEAMNDVRRNINNLISYYSPISSILVYIPGGEYEDITISSTSLTTAEITEAQNIIKKYMDKPNNFGYSFFIENSQIYFVYSELETSFYAIKLSKENLIENFVTIGSSINKQKISIFDKGNKIIFVSSDNILEESEFENILNNFTNNEVILSGYSIYSNVLLLDCIDLYSIVNLKNDIAQLYTPSILLVTLITILEVILSIVVTHSFAGKPIKCLLQAMEKVENGDLKQKINETSITDIQTLYNGFNKMTDSIETQIKENYIQQLQIKEGEFKILQSQVNPHFLYNCFLNISSLCESNNTEKAKQFTQKLAKYYFYITDMQSIVNLKDEWNHMLGYLEIQKIRFEDRVKFEISPLPPEFENYKVPKLLFQPIVENCYKYVFSKVLTGGILKITFEEFDNYLKFNFEDNGKNLTEQDIIKLQERVLKASLIGKHGLTNIYRRLEHFSGEGKNITLSMGSLGGLQVSIYLKKKEE